MPNYKNLHADSRRLMNYPIRRGHKEKYQKPINSNEITKRGNKHLIPTIWWLSNILCKWEKEKSQSPSNSEVAKDITMNTHTHKNSS